MRKIAVVGIAAVLATGLCSCSPRAELALGSSSPRLKAELSKLAADYSRSHGMSISLAETATSSNATTISIDWAFARGAGGSSPQRVVAPEKIAKAGIPMAPAFERWATGAERKGWAEIPLLWDGWGLAGTPERLAKLGPSKTFAWKDRGALRAAKLSLLAAGADPGVLQSLFWLSSAVAFDPRAAGGIELGTADRLLPSARALFQAFSSLPREPSFYPGCLRFAPGDIVNIAKGGGAYILYGNYSWQRGMLPGRESGAFRPLAYPTGGGYAMPASILAGRVLGSGASASKAEDFLLWLLRPENQNKLSYETGLMSINLNASVLDPDEAAARNAAIGASDVVAVDPSPAGTGPSAVWTGLLGRMLASPAEWQRALSEAEAAKRKE
jgi:hypothetical protein